MKIRMAVINPNKHSWYIIEQRYYWKLNEKTIPVEEKKDKLYWFKESSLSPLLRGR